MNPQAATHLDTLHSRFLARPPKPAEAERVLLDYRKALTAVSRLNVECAEVSRQMNALGQERKLARPESARLWKELQEALHQGKSDKTVLRLLKARRTVQRRVEWLDEQCQQAYQRAYKLGVTRQAKQAELDALAEKLLLSHGLAPIVIEGRTYDFASNGERVYLTPRRMRK